MVDATRPAWSCDGRWIAFLATDGLVHIVAPDGSGERVASRTQLAAPLVPGYHLTLAPDGHSVTYSTGDYTHELDLVAPYSISGGIVARLRGG